MQVNEAGAFFVILVIIFFLISFSTNLTDLLDKISLLLIDTEPNGDMTAKCSLKPFAIALPLAPMCCIKSLWMLWIHKIKKKWQNAF